MTRGGLWLGVEVVDGFYGGSGDGFDGEGAGDAGAGVVDEGLIVEGFFAGRFVVGDGFEGDVGDLFVFESAADAFVGVGEIVVVEGGAHEALFGEGGGDAGGVAGDPAAAPLLGDECGGAGTTGGVKGNVARISRHEDAAFDRLSACLHNEDLGFGETSQKGVSPKPRYLRNRKVGQVLNVAETVGCDVKSVGAGERFQAVCSCLPRLGVFLSAEAKWEDWVPLGCNVRRSINARPRRQAGRVFLFSARHPSPGTIGKLKPGEGRYSIQVFLLIELAILYTLDVSRVPEEKSAPLRK